MLEASGGRGVGERQGGIPQQVIQLVDDGRQQVAGARREVSGARDPSRSRARRVPSRASQCRDRFGDRQQISAFNGTQFCARLSASLERVESPSKGRPELFVLPTCDHFRDLFDRAELRARVAERSSGGR